MLPLFQDARFRKGGAARMPYYNLELVKRLISAGHYRITVAALQSANAMGFDDADLCDCVLIWLSVSHFYKSMPAEKIPGLWQDVYRLAYQDTRVYLKLQIGFAGQSVIISFKEDESPG